MRFSGDYLYRARVTSYPAGSHHEVDYGGELHTEPVEGWQPPGWRPVGDYVQMLGTDEFVWPVTNKVWGSRATALKRVKLLEFYGATAVVERSSRITWPEDPEPPTTSDVVPTLNAKCFSCGSKFEVCGEPSTEDYDALEEFNADHSGCGSDL